MLRLVGVSLAWILLVSACGDDAGPLAEPITITTAPTPSTSVAESTTSITTAPTPSTSVAESTTSTATTDSSTVPDVVATPVTVDALRSAMVMIDEETVDLVDGIGEGPPFVRLVGAVVGDVTGDGIDDAAVVLAHEYPQTTGRFSSLVVFHHPADELVHTEPIVFVDRGRVHDLRVHDGEVELRWSELMFWSEGQQTTNTFAFVDNALVESSSAVTLLVEDDQSGLRLNQTGRVDFGSSVDEVRATLLPVLGEPAERWEEATCWGRQEGLRWEGPGGVSWMVFLEDEFYEWGSSDGRFVTDQVVSPGSSVAWLEQWFGQEFTTVTIWPSGGGLPGRAGSGGLRRRSRHRGRLYQSVLGIGTRATPHRPRRPWHAQYLVRRLS